MKNDKLLVARILLSGDREAFGRLVELYQSPIRRFFLNLTDHDEELSKDLAQETFVKVWLNINSFRALSGFSTWLYRIAYNTFYDSIRARKQHCEEDVENFKYIAAEIPDKDLRMDMSRALSILREEERTVMLLFYMEDQSIDKIAKIMDCPSGTVKSHLSRGKRKLAVFLENSGYNR